MLLFAKVKIPEWPVNTQARSRIAGSVKITRRCVITSVTLTR